MWVKWIEEECDLAAKIFADMPNRTIDEKAKAVSAAMPHRSYYGVRSRFVDYGPTFKGERRYLAEPRTIIVHVSEDGRIDIPPSVLEERDRRGLLEHSSITASFFGDPLPGYSALDRRTA